MKKLILAVVILISAAVAWAAPTTIVMMNNGEVKFSDAEAKVRGYPGLFPYLIAQFEKENPGVKVNLVTRDVSKGSLTFDAMLAAGNPPDVWLDAGSYHFKYLKADYAIPLQKYIKLDRFQPGLLAPYSVGGNQYAVPIANIATGLAINTSMLAKIGYTLPPLEKWTTDEYLVLAEKLKQAGIPATCIQAEGGLNSWTNVWLRAFGAEMFKPGDWSKVAINTPAALQGLAYIKTIMDKGYTTPPLETNDDDLVELFTTGQVFSGMMQNGHTDYWVPEQVKQGKLASAFDYTFIEFPHAVGRQHTPVSGYQTTIIGKVNKAEATTKLIAKLIDKFTGYEAVFYWATLTGGFSPLKDFIPSTGAAALPSYKAIAALAPAAGQYQEYPPGDKGAEVRRIWYALSEQWVRGKLTAEVFLAQFEVEANKVLAAK